MSDLENNAPAPVDIALSVIMVTYGAGEMALRSLESLAGETPTLVSEVLVVDNGSPDGLAEIIASRFPQFRVFAQAGNLGFAGACNLAADLARGRYLLFLNPDTIVLDRAIDRLFEFARQRPEAGLWGGRTLFADGTVNPTSCRRRPSLWTLFCSALALDTRFPASPLFGAVSYGGWPRDCERSVDILSGNFLLVDRILWDRLAGFSPAFFMYGEDDDLCLRAARSGFRPLFTPHAVIIHHGSGTEPDQARKIGQILAARALLIRAHFSWIAGPMALALLMLRPCLGRLFAKPALRGLWNNVWARRALWASGEF